MRGLRDIRDEVSIKRKKMKIYSEFNYSSRNIDCTLQTDYSNLCEQKREVVKQPLDKYHKKAPNDKIINIYLRHQKPRPSNTRERSITTLSNAEDTCYVCGLDNLWAENCPYNYSGTDIKRLLLFMEYTYKTMHRVLEDVKLSKIQGSRRADFNPTILVINSKKLKKFFTDKHKPKKVPKYKNKHFLGGDGIYMPKESSLLSEKAASNAFDIKIEPQRIKFELSICKYSLSSLLNTLAAVCNFSRLFFPTYECTKVPSLCLGYWYFRSISQGYLLRILLRNINVVTLNVMRKLYFVLITDTTPNLIIQINFILKHGVFMVYETDDANAFFPETINLSNGQQHILERSTSTDTLYILKKNNENVKINQPLNAITYSMSRDFPLEQKRSSSTFIKEALSTQTYVIDDASVTFSDTESFNHMWSNTTINFTVNKSVGSFIIFPTDERTNQYKVVEKKSASTLCNFMTERDCNTSLTHNKLTLTKLSGCEAIKACLNLHSERENINETMFDPAPTDIYVNVINKYIKQFTCQKFYENFLQGFAHSLFNTFFSYEV